MEEVCLPGSNRSFFCLRRFLPSEISAERWGGGIEMGYQADKVNAGQPNASNSMILLAGQHPFGNYCTKVIKVQGYSVYLRVNFES